MRRTLGTLTITLTLALTLLAGCGDDSGESADDPAPSESTSAPTDTSTDDTSTDDPGGLDQSEPPVDETSTPDPSTPDYTVVALLAESNAGGEVSSELVAVGEDDELEAFLAQFTSTELQDDLRSAVADYLLPPGAELVAATVAIGCDAPPGVAVTQVGDTFEVAPQKVVDPLPECFAPVTTVSVVQVPSA